jgi:hypothetical protein
MVLGSAVTLLDFTGLLKPSHMGVNVDGLAYLLHRPMVCGCRMRDRDSCQVLPCPIALQWAVAPFRGV